jgi:hypothetical protein
MLHTELTNLDPAREALRCAYRAILAWPKKTAPSEKPWPGETEEAAETEPTQMGGSTLIISQGENHGHEN